MDLKRIFSGRVVGLLVFILAVLFLGAAFNVNLEGMDIKIPDMSETPEGMSLDNVAKKPDESVKIAVDGDAFYPNIKKMF
jgi:hypothetical protein